MKSYFSPLTLVTRAVMMRWGRPRNDAEKRGYVVSDGKGIMLEIVFLQEYFITETYDKRRAAKSQECSEDEKSSLIKTSFIEGNLSRKSKQTICQPHYHINNQ